ncbi:MAG: hypothetical protein K8U57_30180 [Planctomycetes bacterium]|nr:hypothetical protein [Planctomycetota bacterium]
MKKLLWATAALAIVAVNTATAGDIVYKPINTNKLVVQPSRAAANVASQAINLVGNTAAGSLESNGYIKTINNLFSRKIIVPHTQAGPSALPSPNLFPSTQYKSYNTPVMPIVRPR